MVSQYCKEPEKTFLFALTLAYGFGTIILSRKGR